MPTIGQSHLELSSIGMKSGLSSACDERQIMVDNRTNFSDAICRWTICPHETVILESDYQRQMVGDTDGHH
jgi:hypothetical protein